VLVKVKRLIALSLVMTIETLASIRWQYRDSEGGLGTAHGVVLAEKADRFDVEIVRDGKRTGLKASVLRSHAIVDRSTLGGEQTLKDRFKFGPPSNKAMNSINQLLPNGADKLTADQVISVPFVAADNLINRSYDKWDIPSLATMAAMLPGLPAMLDHDWDDISKIWGTIYNAELVQSNSAPNAALDRAGNLENNRKIVATEGFSQVVFEVFATVDSPVVRALQGGHPGSISTGGFRFRDYVCPLCNTSFSDEENCLHVPPDNWWRLPGTHATIAPYAIRVGMFDIGEASIVSIPNLPNAGII
jgi:hypothetical protein